MKKSGPDRQYTEDFRQTAVKQVIDGGRSIQQVALSLEIPKGTLGNWVSRMRRGWLGLPVNVLEYAFPRRLKFTRQHQALIAARWRRMAYMVN